MLNKEAEKIVRYLNRSTAPTAEHIWGGTGIPLDMVSETLDDLAEDGDVLIDESGISLNRKQVLVGGMFIIFRGPEHLTFQSHGQYMYLDEILMSLSEEQLRCIGAHMADAIHQSIINTRDALGKQVQDFLADLRY